MAASGTETGQAASEHVWRNSVTGACGFAPRPVRPGRSPTIWPDTGRRWPTNVPNAGPTS